MIGSLMYLTSSRPDLVFVVCMCARYQAKPTEKHLHAVKQIFRYLKGTIDIGLWYSKDSCITLTTYANADHGRYQDTRHITSGSAQFLGDKLVSWSSKKQKSIAISSIKAEYIALSGVVPASAKPMGTLERLCGIRDRGSSLGSSHSRWCSSGPGELPELFLVGWTMAGAKKHPRSGQNRRDLPKDIPLDSVEVLRRSDTYARNPVKEILLNLNLPDHSSILTEPEVHIKVEMEIPRSSKGKFIIACSYSIDVYNYMMKTQMSQDHKEAKDYKITQRDEGWLMISKKLKITVY
ncbi:hypothetical protein Tco_0492756 [Tanacetum coccineum]